MFLGFIFAKVRYKRQIYIIDYNTILNYQEYEEILQQVRFQAQGPEGKCRAGGQRPQGKDHLLLSCDGHYRCCVPNLL